MGSWKRSTVGTPGNRATSSLVEEEKPVKGNIEVVLLGEEGRPEEQGRGAGGGGCHRNQDRRAFKKVDVASPLDAATW